MEGVNCDFSVPDGFRKEELTESQLNYEDIDEDCELWLVRMPSVLEPSNLKDCVISLNGSASDLKHKEESRRNYQCTSLRCESDQFSLVLPRAKNNKLKVVNKNFSGTIFITDEALSPTSISSHNTDTLNNLSEEIYLRKNDDSTLPSSSYCMETSMHINEKNSKSPDSDRDNHVTENLKTHNENHLNFSQYSEASESKPVKSKKKKKHSKSHLSPDSDFEDNLTKTYNKSHMNFSQYSETSESESAKSKKKKKHSKSLLSPDSDFEYSSERKPRFNSSQYSEIGDTESANSKKRHSKSHLSKSFKENL